MDFDPSQFGATAVTQATGFNPAQFGATAVSAAPVGSAPLDGGAWTALAAPTSAPAAPTPPEHQDFIDAASDFIKSSPLGFTAPLGEAVGNSIGSLGAAIKFALQGNFSAAHAALKPTPDEPSAKSVVGSAIQSVATPVSLALGGGTGASAAGRIANAFLKYGAVSAAEGAGNALSNNASASGAAEAGVKSGIAGGLGGSAFQGAGEGLSAVLNALPARLVQNALPKLSNDNVQTVLQNTKLGPVSSLLSDSEKSVSELGGNIHTVLNGSQYASDTGAGDFAVQKTLHAFPNSDYTTDSIINTVKKIVPAQSKLVTKVANGTATLADKNALRQAIDPVIKKVFSDAPDVSANKQIGAEFANALRGEVQALAPETQPMFSRLSKEIDYRNALETAQEKLDKKSTISLYDLTAALGGFTTGGPVGAAATVAAEKALRSPAVGIAAAKGIKAALPALSAGANAARGPLITAGASQFGQPSQ